MRTNMNLYQGVAGGAVTEPRLALAAQSQDLTVAYAWWNLDVERRSVWQRYSSCSTSERIEEVDVETVSGIRATMAAVPLTGSTKES